MAITVSRCFRQSAIPLCREQAPGWAKARSAIPTPFIANVARMERSEIRGGIVASRQSRITLRSILATFASPSPAGEGSTAAGGRGGVLGTAASTSARQRCHPTRRASRVDLPLQGR